MPTSPELVVLPRVAAAVGVDASEQSWCKIANILELMGKYRGSLNLTGARSRAELEELAVDGVLAVAAVLGAGIDGGAWLDVGSGAGFPGLFVAALWPGPVTLVEPRAKRASFLELCVATLGSGAVVRRARLEQGVEIPLDAGGSIGGPFAVASARAVFPAPVWCVEAPKWLRDGGVFLVHGHAGETIVPDPAGVAEWGAWRVEAHVSRGTDG